MKGSIKFRLIAQLEEILGPDNRWYCSQHYRRHIDDPEILFRYFCTKGGAEDFAKRWDEAMGEVNRYYCSQFYCRPITDEETLWRYYMRTRLVNAGGDDLDDEGGALCPA